MAKVLILDESKSMRNAVRELLELQGFSTESADDDLSAAEMCKRTSFDVIVSDSSYKRPEGNTPFIILSSTPSIDAAITAVRDGAADYLVKPIDMNRLIQSVKAIVEGQIEAPVVRQRRKAGRQPSGQESEMVGNSPQMIEIKKIIDKVAPTDARVLITGENGTGKELVARWLHLKSMRSTAPFVEVNCAAIPSELIESELFGHEKGSFTSAFKQRKGKFELANGGTLFMDEIGDMSLSAQAKVLRALQESRITRVGGDTDLQVDVRVVAATNKNLRHEIEKGNFREDLYHRIGVIVIKVPPLREHSDDVPLLVDYFLPKICAESNLPMKIIDPNAVAVLRSMAWTGNIRELRNVLERLIILSGDHITADDVNNYCCC